MRIILYMISRYDKKDIFFYIDGVYVCVCVIDLEYHGTLNLWYLCVYVYNVCAGLCIHTYMCGVECIYI